MTSMLGTLTVRDNRIEARMPFAYKDRLKSVLGARWDPERRVWYYPPSPATAVALAKELRGQKRVMMDEQFKALLQAGLAAREQMKTKTETSLPDIPVTRYPAWLHQRQAYWFASRLPAAMLAMDMGTGKSKVAVDIIQNDQSIQTVLIIAPLSVVGVWPREFKKHAKNPGRFHVVPLNTGSVSAKLQTATQALEQAALSNQVAVLVVNYESVWREPFGPWAKNRTWDMVILDESHRIKAPGGVASKYVGELGRRARRRLCLTGTPLPHSPLDAYAQFRFLDPGVFGTSFARFRSQYAIMGGYGGYEVIGYQRQDEFNERFYSITYRVGKEVLDLPPVQHLTRKFRLSPRALAAYRQLERNFLTEIEEGRVTASNALVKLLRLQQVTGGYLPIDDAVDDRGEPVVTEIDTGKRDLLREVLEDIPADEPVVVFARFTRDLDNIRAVAEGLGRTYGELSGRRKDLTADATYPEGVQVMGVQIQSGGVGIDLTRARYAIYYSLGFSLGDYDQSLARVHRPGQERETIYIHLLAEGTVDEKVYSVLRERREVVEAILADRSLEATAEDYVA